MPVGIPAIFVPFFLAHDRLRELERKMILEVEGETPEWFMKLIRHEAAHAYSYAYRLQRKRKWQETFGLASTEETPSSTVRDPTAASYVVHLDDWYAQSHPDEDFAETFAVWLTPGLDWRAALQGLEGAAKAGVRGRIDAVARRQTAAASAGVPRGGLRLPQRQAQDLLRQEAKALRGLLSRIFTTRICGSCSPPDRKCPDGVKASAYSARAIGKHLMDAVCQWTNENKYRVNKLLTRLIDRCDQLDLHVQPSDPQARLAGRPPTSPRW